MISHLLQGALVAGDGVEILLVELAVALAEGAIVVDVQRLSVGAHLVRGIERQASVRERERDEDADKNDDAHQNMKPRPTLNPAARFNTDPPCSC